MAAQRGRPRTVRLGAWYVVAFCAVGAMPVAAQKQSERDPFGDVKWKKGFTEARLGSIARLAVPDGYMFASADDTRRILEAMHNPCSGDELGLIAPQDMSWFVVFEYDEVGYVKDDDKDKLDGDVMLKSIREGTTEANKERQRRGWDALEVVGWEEPPHYDAATNNLVWAVRPQ